MGISRDNSRQRLSRAGRDLHQFMAPGVTCFDPFQSKRIDGFEGSR
jgi:hypothetical protein